jgi:hypothetical protein
LSSAILYVAIVVIWAAVLIPRWLRRDPVVAVPEGEIEEEATMDTVAEELAPLPPAFPAPPLSVRRQEPARRDAARGDAARETAAPETVARERRPRVVEDRGKQEEDRLVRAGVRLNQDEAPDVDLQEDPGHRRVVKARKRMLLMLVALAVGAGLLAGAKMAAWWVVVPPAVMLAGYTLLLREAAAADRQRREDLRVRRAEAARARAQTGRRAAPAGPAGAKIIAIPSLPEPEAEPEEEIYDQYADAKLRAVGD